ncbi:MAG: hypothetical protein M1510_08085 [Nitrospirae bacterium]|nr:hypothetical protein [Nitrospirota bacterium]
MFSPSTAHADPPGSWGGLFSRHGSAGVWIPENGALTVEAALSFSSDSEFSYLGTNKGLFRRKGAGEWVKLEHVPGSMPFSLLPAGNDLYIATEEGVSLSSDRGNSWTLLREGIFFSLVSDGKRVAAGGKDGVFITGDRGRTWIPAKGIPPGDVRSMASGPNGIYAVLSGSLYQSTDGYEFSRVEINREKKLQAYCVYYSTPVKKLYLATDEGLMTSEYGTNWTRTRKHKDIYYFSPVISMAVNPLNPGIIHIASEDAFIVSRDGGENWEADAEGLPSHRPVNLVVFPDAVTDKVYALSSTMPYQFITEQAMKRIDTKKVLVMTAGFIGALVIVAAVSFKFVKKHYKRGE